MVADRATPRNVNWSAATHPVPDSAQVQDAITTALEDQW